MGRVNTVPLIKIRAIMQDQQSIRHWPVELFPHQDMGEILLSFDRQMPIRIATNSGPLPQPTRSRILHIARAYAQTIHDRGIRAHIASCDACATGKVPLLLIYGFARPALRISARATHQLFRLLFSAFFAMICFYHEFLLCLQHAITYYRPFIMAYHYKQYYCLSIDRRIF